MAKDIKDYKNVRKSAVGDAGGDEKFEFPVWILGAALVVLVILAVLGFHRFHFVSIGVLAISGWYAFRLGRILWKRRK